MLSTSPWRLDWSSELSVCIPEIDAEHQRFIALVNALNEAIIGRKGLAVIRQCMQAIVDDAVAHFSHEEELFKEWGYSAAAEHAQKHAQLLAAMREIMGRFSHETGEYVWVDAGLQVKDTLIEHLLTEDMKYRDYHLKFGTDRPKGV